MTQRWTPHVTVAAVMARDGRYLLVEEHTPEGLRLNTPAGHLECGESPEQGAAREALEETAHPFTPTHLLGVYLTRTARPPAPGGAAAADTTYLRLAYCGTVGAHQAHRALDQGIVRTLWLTPDEVRASAHRHRSPLVLQCMEDHLRGQRFALSTVFVDPAVLGLVGA
jgi:8-oxo-dGTP pyrophosphatase MutT (NUDIX family)